MTIFKQFKFIFMPFKKKYLLSQLGCNYAGLMATSTKFGESDLLVKHESEISELKSEQFKIRPKLEQGTQTHHHPPLGFARVNKLKRGHRIHTTCKETPRNMTQAMLSKGGTNILILTN